MENVNFHFTLLSPKSMLSPKPIFFNGWKHLERRKKIFWQTSLCFCKFGTAFQFGHGDNKPYVLCIVLLSHVEISRLDMITAII